MYACLAVTCHLHFWQNDRDLLRATVVTRGWNGYRNKSQHRKSTLEKKILPPFQQGFEPATFQSRVRRSNHWAIPDPLLAPVVEGCFYSCSSCSKTSKLKSDDLDENRSCWNVFFLFMTPRRITCTSDNSSLLRAVCGFLWVQTNPYKIDKEEGFTHFWRS